MTSQLADMITEKLTDIESLAESMQSNRSSAEKSNLKIRLNDFIMCMPEILETCETSHVINVIELFSLFSSKYHFDEILGTGLFFNISIMYFKAYTYQNNMILDQLSETYSEIESIFEAYLDLESPNFLKSNSARFIEQKQLISSSVCRKIAYSLIYFETLLQHTALLSQRGSNLRAKDKSEKCYKGFVNLFKHLNNLMGVLLLVGPSNLKPESGIQITSDEIFHYIEFLKTFSIPAFSYIENKWSSEFAQWRFNKDTTDKFILRTIEATMINQNVKINFDKEWANSFHIINVVKLSAYADLKKKLEAPVINDDLVLQLILTFSCCIFSLAAENRFIVKKEVMGDIQMGSTQKANAELEFRLQKNTQFIYSEKVHLKSIELLLFAFDNNMKLISHFLGSYKKNYSFNVLVIDEVNESCFSSAKNSEYIEGFAHKSTSESQNMEYINQLNKKMWTFTNRNGPDKNVSDVKSRVSIALLDNQVKISNQGYKIDQREKARNFNKNQEPSNFNRNDFTKKPKNDNIDNHPTTDRQDSPSKLLSKPRTSMTNVKSLKKISIDKINRMFEKGDSNRKSQPNVLATNVKSQQIIGSNNTDTFYGDKVGSGSNLTSKQYLSRNKISSRSGAEHPITSLQNYDDAKDPKIDPNGRLLIERKNLDIRLNSPTKKLFRF